MSNHTVAEVMLSLREDQRQDFYYVIGYALDKGKRCRTLGKYKRLIETLDDIQKKALEYLIEEACKEN